MTKQEVTISKNLAADIEDAVAQQPHDRLFVLTDTTTVRLCWPLISSLSPLASAQMITIGDTDENKTLESLLHVWEGLQKGGATRHSLLLNLGGGMVTDLGGFAASTFKRGIRFINIPTTLLSQVDASVGGKTGINFGGLKNEIGVFSNAASVIISSEFLSNVSDTKLQTELDLHIYQLQRKWLDYQVNLSNRMVEILTNGDPEAQTKVQELAHEKSDFQDTVDELFLETGKTIKRDRNEIFFDSYGETITPYKLSSGEKQMLIILLTVLVHNKKPFVLFMDEPEVSLHVEWQQQLLELLTHLNPNAQIILTTHSPAVIMNGWGDRVTDVEDIVVKP